MQRPAVRRPEKPAVFSSCHLVITSPRGALWLAIFRLDAQTPLQWRPAISIAPDHYGCRIVTCDQCHATRHTDHLPIISSDLITWPFMLPRWHAVSDPSFPPTILIAKHHLFYGKFPLNLSTIRLLSVPANSQQRPAVASNQHVGSLLAAAL